MKLKVFHETNMRTDCDVCGVHFDMVKGGVCDRCRRVLCARHLHGSFVRRLLVDLGVAPVCLDCRGQRDPRAAAP